MACRTISEDQRTRRIPASIPRIRLQKGELYADIIEDRRGDPSLITCVIQRLHSPEVLFLGQFHTRSEAQIAAEQVLGDFAIGQPTVWLKDELVHIASDAQRRMQNTRWSIDRTAALIRGTQELVRQSREVPTMISRWHAKQPNPD